MGTEGERGLDIGPLLSSTGMMALDCGFAGTAWCRNSVGFVDGRAGALRYRGYPIEQPAAHSCFGEVGYLPFHGELPTLAQLDARSEAITVETLLDEGMRQMFDACPREAHPMVLLAAAMTALGAFPPELGSTPAAEQAAIHLPAKMPTAAAFAHRRSSGLPWVYPQRSPDYSSRFFPMTFSIPGEDCVVDPVAARALDVLLLRTSTTSRTAPPPRWPGGQQPGERVRLGGLGHERPLRALARRCQPGRPRAAAAHPRRRRQPRQVTGALQGPPQPLPPARLRPPICRTCDPRAGGAKGFVDEPAGRRYARGPLFDIALALEHAALTDDCFIERHLYPNVDFHSGIGLRTLGFPTRMLPVLFALGRLPGWTAPWKEGVEDPETHIGRPRLVYVGPPQRATTPPSTNGADRPLCGRRA
ncbi:MAG: citrate/2-methylcitrate synthase [Actinomycetota bacterium]